MHLVRQTDALILAFAFFGSWIAFIQFAWRSGLTSWLLRVLPRYVAPIVTDLVPLVLATAVTTLVLLALGERFIPN